MSMTDLTRWKGQDVVDPTGDKIGQIEVRTGLFGRRISFVPIAEAQPAGDYVAVPYTKDQVKDAPNAEPDGLLSEQEEARLYDHYGLPYSDAQSDTGLPTAGGYDMATTTSPDAGHRRRHDPLRRGAAGRHP